MRSAGEPTYGECPPSLPVPADLLSLRSIDVTKEDTIVEDGFDPYSEAEIRDLSNGVLMELKRLVEAEHARRKAECQELFEPTQKRASRKQKAEK